MNNKLIYFIAQIALAGTFFGHGIYAFFGKPNWIGFLTFWGFNTETSLMLMKIIGIQDILIVVLTFIHPKKYLWLYCIFWTFATALMRPLTGESILEWIERFSNIGIPLILYVLETEKLKQWN
jgi:hypothetical protein